jgi:cytochrome c oxidase subunit 2
MEGPVIIVSDAQFVAWAGEQQSLAAAAQTPASRGELYAKTNCLSCHTVDGSKLIGPTWLGLYGSQVPLSDGSTVTADDAYLKESILNPSVKIVAGFETQLMPAAFSALTDEEIANIIAYIKTLK